MHSAKLLVIEDHKDISEMVVAFFQKKGFRVDSAHDGLTGYKMASKGDYDIIVLDIMLPAMTGLQVCQKLRKEARDDTPIIMLTARDTVGDKIAGLESGADDYLIKPFSIQELDARIQALIRRHHGEVTQEVLQLDDLIVDTAQHSVEREGQSLKVTPIGFKILVCLLRAHPNLVTRRQIEKAVWGRALGDSETLRSHMYSLRKVVDKPFEKTLIQTIPGRGYQMSES